MMKTQKEYVHLKVDDALDLIAFLGKDIKELNIPEEAIEYIGAHPFTVYYDTSFLGETCDIVTLGFTNDYDSKTDKANSVNIICKNTKFLDCKAYFDSHLGECHNSGTTPYAAVNGGAQIYFTYYKDGVKYHLSMGSANNYYKLELSLGEPKNPPVHGNIGMVNQAGFIGNGMNFGMGFGMNSGMVSGVNPAAPAPAANNKEAWICPECGRKNFGKFCEGCGKASTVL